MSTLKTEHLTPASSHLHHTLQDLFPQPHCLAAPAFPLNNTDRGQRPSCACQEYNRVLSTIIFYLYTPGWLCMYKYLSLSLSVCIYIYVHLHVYIYIYICMYVRIYRDVYMYQVTSGPLPGHVPAHGRGHRGQGWRRDLGRCLELPGAPNVISFLECYAFLVRKFGILVHFWALYQISYPMVLVWIFGMEPKKELQGSGRDPRTSP